MAQLHKDLCYLTTKMAEILFPTTFFHDVYCLDIFWADFGLRIFYSPRLYYIELQRLQKKKSLRFHQ